MSRDAAFDALQPTLSANSKPEATVQSGILHNGLLFLSGQVAFVGSELLATGRLGDDVDIETGQAAARQCAINLLGRCRDILGSLDNIDRVLKLTVFVASAPGFRDQPAVANGASAVFRDILGDQGTHGRSAVGVAELPLGTPVEVEAIIAVK